RGLLLEDLSGPRVRADVEERLELLMRDGRVVAEAGHPLLVAIPAGDRALVDAHHGREMTSEDVCHLARIEARRQLAAEVQEQPQLAREGLASGEVPGRLQGRRGLVGEDRQE